MSISLLRSTNLEIIEVFLLEELMHYRLDKNYPFQRRFSADIADFRHVSVLFYQVVNQESELNSIYT